MKLELPGASARLWLAHDLAGAPGTTGMIGELVCENEAAQVALLEEAHARLTAEGAARVVGPMNGSTWASYRIALPAEPGDALLEAPAFPGEPPAGRVRLWLEAGFREVARYTSAIAPVSSEAPELVVPDGITVRTFDAARFDEELRVLFAVSLASFADNPWYAPIDYDGFAALYEPMRGRFDPGMVWIAERAGRPVGFQFSYPEPGGPGRAPLTRAVAKTLAVVPEARGLKLGRHLLDRVDEAARVRGFAAVVHALMHEDNRSRAMSDRRGARVFRRYALFERPA